MTFQRRLLPNVKIFKYSDLFCFLLENYSIHSIIDCHFNRTFGHSAFTTQKLVGSVFFNCNNVYFCLHEQGLRQNLVVAEF